MLRKIGKLASYLSWLIRDKGWRIHRERIPCADGIHHTDYSLLRTAGSESVMVMPESNFLLTSAENQLAEREALADKGFHLNLETPLEERIAIHETRV